MKSSTVIISIAFVTVCQIITCLTQDFNFNDVIDDDGISDDVADLNNGGQFSSESENKNEKRAQLSLNGELRSLAQMVYNAQRQGERSNQHSALLKLGKRGWRLPIFDFDKLGIKSSSNKQYPQISTVTRRRSQQLSVSGPLKALANMLENEGRRRQKMESLHNRMKLLQVGKRSEDDLQFDDVTLQEKDSFDSDYL